jgi:hypothetical protein
LEVSLVPARTRIGSGGFSWERALYALVVAAAAKFVIDEVAKIAEHGFDNWRRRRFGW